MTEEKNKEEIQEWVKIKKRLQRKSEKDEKNKTT